MAKITRLFRFDFNDFKEAPAFFRKFLEMLNTFLQTIYFAFNNITILENVVSFIYEEKITPSQLPLKIQKQFNNKVLGVTIQQVNRTDGTALSTAITIDWKEEGGYVKVYALPGMAAADHNIRLLITGQ